MILVLVEAVKNLKNAVVQIYNLLFVKTTVATYCPFCHVEAKPKHRMVGKMFRRFFALLRMTIINFFILVRRDVHSANIANHQLDSFGQSPQNDDIIVSHSLRMTEFITLKMKIINIQAVLIHICKQFLIIVVKLSNFLGKKYLVYT